METEGPSQAADTEAHDSTVNESKSGEVTTQREKLYRPDRSVIILMMIIGGIAFLAIVGGVLLGQSAQDALEHSDKLTLERVQSLADQIKLADDLFKYGIVVFAFSVMIIGYMIIYRLEFYS